MRVSRLVPSLLMLAMWVAVETPARLSAAEQAAEQATDQAAGQVAEQTDAMTSLLHAATVNQVPSGWTWTKAENPKATVAFGEDTVQLNGEPGHWSWLQRALSGQDGSDDQPLVISCAIAAVGKGALSNLPASLVVRWGESDLLAVGLADHPERNGDDGISWAGWVAAGKRGEQLGTIEPYQRESHTQVRILLLSKVVIAQASRDGFDWRTILTRERKGALVTAPTALALGHGWLRPALADGQLIDNREKAKGGKDKAGMLPAWHFTGLRVVRVSHELPATWTKNYQRKDSGDDTRDAIYESTFPSTWQIAGPFTAAQDPIAAGGPDASGVAWKAVVSTGKASDHILQLDDVLTGGGSGAVRYARFSITCDQPRLERFLFDGLREATLSVNGSQLVTARSKDERQIKADRLGTIAWLRAGENTILVKVIAGTGKGDSRLILRHEPGDAHYRAALLKRLLIDFPPEAGLMATERAEIAAAWEATGHLAAAVAAFAEVSAAEDAPVDAVVAAYTAQARLHALMHDDAAQAADVAALAKVWANDGADPLSSALRGARLHMMLGREDLAVQLLDKALASAGSLEARLPLTSERMRLHRALKQEERVIADALALAGEFPVSDHRRIAMLATAARFTAALPLAGAATEGSPAAPPKSADFTTVKAAALASRRVNDLHVAALAALGVADQVGAKTMAKAMVEVCADTDPLLIFAGEVSGDEALATVACKRYLAAAAAPAPESASLAELRLRVLRARIATTPLGAGLLAAADALHVQSGNTTNFAGRVWKGIGPFVNDRWQRYDQPPVNPGNPDLAAKVEDRTWREVTADATGMIDINAIDMGAENSVVMLTTEIVTASAGEVVFSGGADDGLSVWCNGAKVYEDRTQRGLTNDSIKVPLTLKAGTNRLTVMVQNGSGGFAFQGRLREAPYPAVDLAHLLAATTTKRDELAAELLALCTSLQAERRPEGVMLAGVVLDVYPELLPRSIEAAVQIFQTCNSQANAPTTNLSSTISWLMRARLAGLGPDRGDFWRDLPFIGAETLRRSGAGEDVIELLQLALLIDPDAYAQARNQLQLALLYRFSGAARLAVPWLTRVIDDPALSPDDVRVAREQLTLLRRIKNDRVRLEPAFEAANAVRLVQRLAAAKDADGLIPAAQKLIDGNPDLAMPAANGVGESGWHIAVDALRQLGPEATVAYRAKYQSRAESQLQAAALSSDAAACERVARRFPLCSTVGPALLRAAELYRDAGDLALARATAALAMPGLSDSPLAARAQALSVLVSPLPVTPATASPAAMRVSFPFAPSDVADVLRTTNRATPYVPAWVQGMVVVHHGDAVWGIDAATGSQRWRVLGAPPAVESFNGLPLWQAGCDGEVMAVRLRDAAHGLAVVVLDPRTGERRWSSATQTQLAGLTAVSSPTVVGSRVYAAFGDLEGNRRLAALAAADGQVLWLTEVPGRSTVLPTIGDLELRVAGHAAAPTVAGRELYWCSDAGVVVRMDAGNGGLTWVVPYVRSVIDPQQPMATLISIASRGPSRIVLAGERLVVAPRDSLAVYALDRATGLSRWEKPLTVISELAGVVSGAKPLIIAQDNGLTALDAADGSLVWHVAGMPHGSALVEPGSLFASIDGAVLRIDPLSGKILTRIPSPAGVNEGTLVRAGKALLATGLLNGVDGVVSTVGSLAKPTTVSLGEGAMLVDSALPLNDAGPTLGILAQWNGGAVRAIIVPEAGTGSERYVRTATWLARFEPGTQPRLAWQVPIDGEAQSWGLTASAVVGVNKGVATWYERSSGRRIATLPTAISPALVFSGDYNVQAQVEAVVCFKWGGPTVDVRDPVNGALWRRHDIGREVIAAQVCDGKLLTIHPAEGLVLDIRDARTGSEKPAIKLPFDRFWDLPVCSIDADHWLIGKGERALVVNLHTYAMVNVDTRGYRDNKNFVRALHAGNITGIYSEDWNHAFSTVFDPGFKLLFEQEHAKVPLALFPDHAVVLHEVNNAQVLHAIDYVSAKMRWQYDLGHERDRWIRALLPWADKTVLISHRRDGWQRFEIINAEGKLQASGNLAGQAGGPVCAEMIGNQLWLGNLAGLTIFGACTADAVEALVPEATQPVAERSLRDMQANFIGAPLEAQLDTVEIDGDFTDWSEVVARTATFADHRTAAVIGPARISGVQLRSVFDANQLAFAVDVSETTGAMVHLCLGLDTRVDEGQQPQTVVLKVEQIDGLTRLQVVDGEWAKSTDIGTAEARACATRTLTGWHFEIGLPWALLRNNAAQRPGDRRVLRYGLAVEAAGDTVEFGHGLTEAIDWSMWPLLNLAHEAKRHKQSK